MIGIPYYYDTVGFLGELAYVSLALLDEGACGVQQPYPSPLGFIDELGMNPVGPHYEIGSLLHLVE